METDNKEIHSNVVVGLSSWGGASHTGICTGPLGSGQMQTRVQDAWSGASESPGSDDSAGKGVCGFFFFIPFGILKSSLMNISLTDNHENIFLLKIRSFQIKPSASSGQTLGDEPSLQEGQFRALILSLEWGSLESPGSFTKHLPPGDLSEWEGGCVIGVLLDHTPRSSPGWRATTADAQLRLSTPLSLTARPASACGCGGLAGRVRHFMFSTGKAQCFICLSRVRRVIHCSYFVFVLKKPSHNSLLHVRLRNKKMGDDCVTVLKSWSRLRQETKGDLVWVFEVYKVGRWHQKSDP